VCGQRAAQRQCDMGGNYHDATQRAMDARAAFIAALSVVHWMCGCAISMADAGLHIPGCAACRVRCGIRTAGVTDQHTTAF
jgi:hypothetical protein